MEIFITMQLNFLNIQILKKYVIADMKVKSWSTNMKICHLKRKLFSYHSETLNREPVISIISTFFDLNIAQKAKLP